MATFMQTLSRGFSFLKQSWQMAWADKDLLKPTIYAMIVGVFVSVVGIIPIILTQLALGGTQIGNALTFVFGALLIFAQFTVSYIFSAMTIHLIYSYLAEGDGRMDHAWSIVRRDFLDIVSLAVASTLVNLVLNFVRGKKKNRGRNFIADIINTIWTEATYLILPAMVVDDINLKAGLKRATYIAKNNLLLIGVSTVGVKWVTGLIGFLLGGTGIALGLGVGFGLVTLFNGQIASIIGGTLLGGLIALFFILVAVLIGNYTTTAYHTCLYLWARDVERAQERGEGAPAVAPPSPLAAALGN